MGKRRFWAWTALALVLGLAGSALAQQLLDLAQFRDLVAARITADHPAVKVTPLGKEQLRIALPGGVVVTSNLERAFGIYAGNPQDLPDILKGLSGSVRLRRPPATQESLVVLVRPESYNPEGNMLRRPLAGGMSALVAQDGPDSFEFPSRAELRAELNLADEAIWRRALQNTRARTGVEPGRLNADRITHINTKGYFASSLLADDAFWDAPQMLIHGAVVVFALARDDLYLVPLSSTDLVSRLAAMAARVRDDPNGLTNDLIVRRNGRWEVLH